MTRSQLIDFVNFFARFVLKDIVYKSDQERAIVSMLNEVIRISKLNGDPQFGSLNSAVPERSAVGESQSNSRAERSVQQVEDVVRTYKSALEARMSHKLASDHPLMHWVVEHAARTYNKYAVSPEGATPYAYLHGKDAKEKLVEVGEKVLRFVPKRLRAKLDLRWNLGVYVGRSEVSNEYYIALPNGDVVKTRSITRVVASGRWDKGSLLNVKGIPGKLTASRLDDPEVDLEGARQSF